MPGPADPGIRAPLSRIEAELLQYLVDFLGEHTFQPSVREIGRALKIPSTKSVTEILGSLERKGYVRLQQGRSRGVELLGHAGGTGTIAVPLLEYDPLTGTMRTVDHVTLDRRLVGMPESFLIRSQPTAAPEHGVLEGDLVVVHPSARAKDGALIAVRVGAATIVRPFVRRGAGVVLGATPGTDEVALGTGDDFEILGVVATVIRPPRA